MTLSERHQRVLERVHQAARRAGRPADGVLMVAVSKTFGTEVVRAALAAGIETFGENRAQELAAKAAALPGAVRWHFIGPLQSNKVRQVVGVAELIHSVDRASIAESVARRASALGVVQDVLVEVNVAGDEAKHGVDPGGAVALAQRCASLQGLRVRGLMTMPPWSEDPEGARPHYRALAALGRSLEQVVQGAPELSMGMTRDLEVAVEEGATIVRVGEAIFGPRGQPAN